MIFKRVMRWDARARVLRVARIMWERGVVGDGKGYSAKLTLALTPRLFGVERQFQGATVTALGVRVHYLRSYGGRFV